MKPRLLFLLFISTILLASCTMSRNAMREANYRLWLNHEDLNYSEQLTGTAEQTKVFMVDWHRVFGIRKWNYGGIGDLPTDQIEVNGAANARFNSVANSPFNFVMDGILSINSINRVEQLAVYDLVAKNPGYDLIMFPQFTSQKKWFVIGSKTTVTCTARLAKIKTNP